MMRSISTSLFLAALLLAATPVEATEINLVGVADGSYSVKISTLKEVQFRRAFKTTVHQQYDFSCGSAAVATLLTFHYQQPISEQQVFKFMYEHGNQEKIREVGFSMLDMKVFLEASGYVADGFEATVEQMSASGVPAIVLRQDRGYNHFVVVKGVRDGKILVGDPALGSRIISREDFEAGWPSKIAFVITNKADLALFNNKTDWNFRLATPMGVAISRESLAAVTLLRPTGRDF
jgi:predicted double-glycine peptidase